MLTTSYNQDKVKVSSGPSLFKLIGIDLFEVPEATHNIAAHPNNRVYLANQRYDTASRTILHYTILHAQFMDVR